MSKASLSRLLQVCNYDVAAAEKGIVYIDEIDKIAHAKATTRASSRCVGRRCATGIAQMLEGAGDGSPG
ncbi:MAG: AAA family ATPase [Chitinophagales bacterium]